MTHDGAVLREMQLYFICVESWIKRLLSKVLGYPRAE